MTYISQLCKDTIERLLTDVDSDSIQCMYHAKTLVLLCDDLLTHTSGADL